MDELITWLRDQLDDDGRVAKAAAESLRCGCHPGSYPGDWTASDTHVLTEMHHVAGGEGWPAAIEDEVAAYIARWDPARVLAEVGAKRRILDLHAPVIDGTQSSWTWFAGSESASLAIVKLLALPYADRDGYREEWRP